MSSDAHSPTRIALLGPQRLAPTVGQALARMNIDSEAQVAIITAGWQEREDEDGELREALGRPVVNLALHARIDQVFRDDPELFAAHRAKQDRLRQLQELYRRRLRHAMDSVRQLQTLATEGQMPAELIDIHLGDAIALVRQLDDQHAAYVREINTEFTETLRPTERDAVARQRDDLAGHLVAAAAVAIAGGHVAVLLNKVRLLDVPELLGNTPILAWAAGAMLLTRRIVLFHDQPPQGRGDAEVLGDGLGLVSGLVALPHARRRLLLGDKRRVSLFARRFAPARGVALDDRCFLDIDESGRWHAGRNTFRLSEDGSAVEPAAKRTVP